MALYAALMEISALPAALQETARIDANGEVSWPDEDAASAIEALTAAGHRVLGLDVRFYLADGTFYEIPWSSSEAETLQAKAEALQALSRIDELERPGNAVERRVLVTWE
jgi:CHASE2 domain-containing sensor protein